MKVLIVGSGGVGESTAAIAKRRDPGGESFERMVMADYDLTKAQAVSARLGDDRRTALRSPSRGVRRTGFRPPPRGHDMTHGRRDTPETFFAPTPRRGAPGSRTITRPRARSGSSSSRCT